MDKLPIVEIYLAIQGEGLYAGIPHLLIRTTGCPMRCQFGNSFCDTPYTSWKPEKGSITIEDIVKLYVDNPHIDHTMITGGSPTMHPELLIQLTEIARKYNHIVTLETEGSRFINGLQNTVVSLSPKLKSSIPKPGTPNPYIGREVSEADKAFHEKNRCNYEEMFKLLDAYGGWIKPVINADTFDQDVEEVEFIIKKLELDKDSVFLMPAGINTEQLAMCRERLFEYCLKTGYSYTDRLHVIVYGEKRGV